MTVYNFGCEPFFLVKDFRDLCRRESRKYRISNRQIGVRESAMFSVWNLRPVSQAECHGLYHSNFSKAEFVVVSHTSDPHDCC